MTQRDPFSRAERDHPLGGDDGAAPTPAERASFLVHELNGLLDGSLRWLSIATRGLPAAADEAIRADLDRTRRRLETVREALERMSEVVRTAAAPGGGSLLAVAGGVTLGEAVDHALDVIRPRARELGVSLGTELEPAVGVLPAGGVYSVILNGLRNALDSIEQANGGQPGEGQIVVRLFGEGARAVLEIADDGVGPPLEVGPARVFSPAYTTHAQGRGVGLAIAKEIADELGGTIELVERPGVPAEARRRGAVLRLRFPAPAAPPGAAGRG